MKLCELMNVMPKTVKLELEITAGGALNTPLFSGLEVKEMEFAGADKVKIKLDSRRAARFIQHLSSCEDASLRFKTAKYWADAYECSREELECIKHYFNVENWR